MASLRLLSAELGGEIAGDDKSGTAKIGLPWPPHECIVTVAWGNHIGAENIVSARAEDKRYQGGARDLVRRLAFEMSRRNASTFMGPAPGCVIPSSLGTETGLYEAIESVLRARACTSVRPMADQEACTAFEGSDGLDTLAWSVTVCFRGDDVAIEVVKTSGSPDAQEESDALREILASWTGHEVTFSSTDL